MTTSKAKTAPAPSKRSAATKTTTSIKKPLKGATRPKTAAEAPKATAAGSAKPGIAPTTKTASDLPAKAATPTVVDAPQSVILGPVLRKKELIDTVVTRSGMKKKDAKPVIEAMLAVLGEAIADKRELNLSPFGHIKVRKERKLPNGRMMVVKLRQNTPPAATDPEKSSEGDD